YWDVLAESGRVALIDPGVIARLGAVLSDTVEAGAGILIDRPTFRTMVAGRGRPVEWALAFAAVQAAAGTARQRRPDHTVRIDIAAADSDRRRRNVVHLGQSGSRVKSQDSRRLTEHADRIPDGAVDRRRHHGVRSRTRDDPLVLARIERGVG